MGRVDFPSAGLLRSLDFLLEEMLEKWRRGAKGLLPQPTPVQLLDVLVLIDREGPVGGRALAQVLQINEQCYPGFSPLSFQTSIGSNCKGSAHSKRNPPPKNSEATKPGVCAAEIQCQSLRIQ